VTCATGKRSGSASPPYGRPDASARTAGASGAKGTRDFVETPTRSDASCVLESMTVAKGTTAPRFRPKASTTPCRNVTRAQALPVSASGGKSSKSLTWSEPRAGTGISKLTGAPPLRTGMPPESNSSTRTTVWFPVVSLRIRFDRLPASCQRPETTYVGSKPFAPWPGATGRISKPNSAVERSVPSIAVPSAAVRPATRGTIGLLLTIAVAESVAAGELTSREQEPSKPKTVPTMFRKRRVSPAPREKTNFRTPADVYPCPAGVSVRTTLIGERVSAFESQTSEVYRPIPSASTAFGSDGKRSRLFMR